MIVFDFDGTLADSFPWFAANFNKASSLFGFKEIKDEDFEMLRHYNARQVLDYLSISWWKIPLIAMFMRRLMSRDLSTIKLFPGTHEVFNFARSKNIRIAIVSSNSESNVRTILGKLSDDVDYFLCKSSLFGKPKKLKKLKALSKFAPSEILCIGDEVRDIEAAKSAHMHSGSVTWGYASEVALIKHSPEYIFHDMREINQVI